jgi:glucose/arabinose dehydrogenase
MSHRFLIALIACLNVGIVQAAAPSSPQPQSEPGPFQVSTVAEGFEHPWALALLPDGRMLITERAGRLRLIDKNGKASAPLRGLPKIEAGGQGGLLDLTLSPEFASDRLVYFSFSEPGDGGASTAVARGRLGEGALEDVKVIWRQVPKVDSKMHFGSRILFASNETIFITTGDRYNQRPKVQDLSTTIGKVVRINRDGSIPADNPFVNRKDARPEIWSYGHRNIQAAALHPETNQLWTIEHGARGGDELNHPQPGKNYGWPIITYGIDYSGVKIGEGTERQGMEQPVYYWDPVIAPSGALFYTGDAFKDWKGDLLVGSMVPGALVRLELQDGKVVKETRYLGELRERIRDVQQGEDGSIYVITDSPKGKVLRLQPKG